MDPAQHSWTVLAAFIESLAGSEWAQLLDRRIAWERQAVEVRSRELHVCFGSSSALMICNANGTANFDPFTKTFCTVSLMFCRRSMLLWRLERSRKACHRRCQRYVRASE